MKTHMTMNKLQEPDKQKIMNMMKISDNDEHRKNTKMIRMRK